MLITPEGLKDTASEVRVFTNIVRACHGEKRPVIIAAMAQAMGAVMFDGIREGASLDEVLAYINLEIRTYMTERERGRRQ